MAGAALFPYDGAMRRSDERRLSVALAVSLLVHAIAIAALRGSLPITYAYSEGTASSLGLQAILAGPAHEPVPEEPAPSEPAIDTSLLSPPAASPLEPPREETPPATAPAPGSGPSIKGANNPVVRMAVGLIEDPARLGPDYVAELAQRFPERVSRTPQLLSTPVMTYPPAALAAGAQQRIAALLTLDANGAIVDVQLFPDDPMFSPDVHDALKNARFAPAEIDTRTVPYWAIVEFFFSLDLPSLRPAPKQANRVAPVIGRQPRAGK
jgi:hypothetical protein